MPKVNINGQIVEVGNEFLSLGPDQQNDAIDEIAQSLQSSKKPGVVEDVAKTILPGLVRGAAGVAGLPRMLEDVAAAAAAVPGRAYNKFFGTGVYEDTPAMAKGRQEAPTGMQPPSQEQIVSGIEGVIGPLYKPQTVAGEYANTLAEFAPGAVFGVGGAVARAAQVAVPAVVSETAGQAARAMVPEAEPYARVGGAIVGGIGASLASPSNPVSAGLKPAMEGIGAREIAAAEDLMKTASAQGVRLTWPEAIQSVTNGGTGLGNVQRVVENSAGGGAKMRGFMADRPQQIERAARETFDTVAPQIDELSPLGPQVGSAFEATVKDAERVRSLAVEPFYKAAGPQVVNKIDDFVTELRKQAAGDKTGIVGGKLREIEKILTEIPGKAAVPATRTPVTDPNTGRVIRYDQTGGSPATPPKYISDIENLDRARKYFRDIIGLPQIGEKAITKEQASAISTSLDDLRTKMVSSSPDYAQGVSEYQRISKDVLEPLMQGPIGKLADKDLTTRKAIQTLFEPNPSITDREVTKAIGALSSKNPMAARKIVRAHLEKTFNETAQALPSGENQFGGAAFSAALRGNAQQRANLEAAIKALPNSGATVDRLEKFLTVVEATGQRQRAGSQTAFNAEMQDIFRKGGKVGEISSALSTGGIKIPARLTKWYEEYRLGKNMGQLAEMMTNPKAGVIWKQIAKEQPNSAKARALALRLIVFGQVANKEPQQ